MSKLRWLTFWLTVIVIGLTPLDAIEVTAGSGITYGRYAFFAMLLSAAITGDVIPRRRPRILYILVGFIVWAAMTMIWSIDREVTGFRCMLLVQYLVIFIVMINVLNRPRRIKIAMGAWIVGAIYIAFLTVINYSAHANSYELYRVGDFGNPNENSFMLIYALIFCYLIDRTRLRLPSMFLTVYAVYAIIANGSRMGVILFIITVSGFCIQLWQTKKRAYVAALVPGILAFGGFVLSRIPTPTLMRILGITKNFENGEFANRENIWSCAVRMLKDNETWNFIGSGWGTFGIAVKKYLGESMGAHNFYLDLWATTGIIGLVIVLCYLWRLYKLIRRTYKATFINYLLLLVPLISMMSTNWQSRRWWFLMGAFIYVVFRTRNLTAYGKLRK